MDPRTTYRFIILICKLDIISPKTYYQVSTTLFNRIFTMAATSVAY
jgi:hypothetical protein